MKPLPPKRWLYVFPFAELAPPQRTQELRIELPQACPMIVRGRRQMIPDKLFLESGLQKAFACVSGAS